MSRQSNQKYLSFIKDVVYWSLTGGKGYQIFLCVVLLGVCVGIYAYSVQLREGLTSTGMSNIISWGLYISNFTFLVGVAAAAVMLILPAYVFKDKDLYKVVIIGESVAVGALVMSMLFIMADLGGIQKVWHLAPLIGRFNWPNSILAWDVMVISGYLALNLLIPAYILLCRYHQQEPKPSRYRPFVFLSIFWAVGIHLVTAFLYQGLPARPFWNNPLLGPRFLASAFAAGPALITIVLVIIRDTTFFKIEWRTFNKLRLIIVVAAVINLVMLFSEIFKEFYFPTHHSLSAIYLFFGLEGHQSLVPWIWTSVILNAFATIYLAINPGKPHPKSLLPGCAVLFLAIWIEKGMGLIVPGLVPSPLGEISNYSPSWVEICVTIGIFSFGAFIVAALIKPAIVIESRFNIPECHPTPDLTL